MIKKDLFSVVFVLLFVVLTCTRSFSQKKNPVKLIKLPPVLNCDGPETIGGHWYFGFRNGLDFSSGTPVYDNAANTYATMSDLIAQECVAVQNDRDGNLLFYTDGKDLYDQNHTVLASNFGAHPSSNGGSIIVPHPVENNQYYLFNTAVRSHTPISSVFSYTLITVNGTQATVSPATTDVTIDAPAGYVTDLDNGLHSGEGVTAIAGCDNSYWIITTGRKGFGPSDLFIVVYKLDGTVLSFHSEHSIPTFVSTASQGTYGIPIEAAPNGKKIAINPFRAGGACHVYDFDNATGTISNERSINRKFYGVCFSPDSKLLYGSVYPSFIGTPNSQIGSDLLFQYNTLAPNLALSEVQVGPYTDLSGLSFDIERGPDNKIYISRRKKNLAVIHNPNVLVSPSNPNACNLDDNGPMLPTFKSGWGLPNVFDANKANVFPSTIVAGNTIACPPVPEDYCVQLRPGETVSWSVTGGSFTGSSTQSNVTVNWGNLPWTLTATITNFDGCQSSETISVSPSEGCPISSGCDWPKSYGSNTLTQEQGDAVVVDANGNVFVHGSVDNSVIFEDGTSILGGVFLAKYDNCGSLLWVIDVSPYGRRFSRMKIDNLGNPVLLATNAITSTVEDIEFKLTKFSNSNGSLIWSNTIEMWKYLPWPSFDINMNNNEIYLVANVNKYLKITQANGTVIVDYTAPLNAFTGYPRDVAYVVKFNASGNQIWQDNMIANQGYAAFQDVVVAENTNRVYICGYTGDHPHVAGDITFNSNTSIAMTPSDLNRLFISSYTSTGNLLYSKMHPTIQGYQTALQIEYSNADNEIYIKNYKNLQLFNTNGNFLSSVSTFYQSGQIYYNQAANYLLTCGTHSCNQLKMEKYEGITKIWTYQVGSCNSKGYIHSVFADPTSDKIFLTGQFWNGDLSFNSTDLLTLAGGRDVFISKIKDTGPTVTYNRKQNTQDNVVVNIEKLNRTAIYPNPEINEHQVKIYNLTGQLVLEAKFEASHTDIDLSSYPDGIYQVVITSGDKRVSEKVVKF